jgi:hypothetical protein
LVRAGDNFGIQVTRSLPNPGTFHRSRPRTTSPSGAHQLDLDTELDTGVGAGLDTGIGIGQLQATRG